MHYAVWLSLIPGIGNIIANRLISAFGSAENVYSADYEALGKVKGLGVDRIKNILESRQLYSAEALIESCGRLGIGILLSYGEFLPELNDLCEDRPLMLFYKGQIDTAGSLDKRAGIIGPRRCTQELKWKTAEVTETYVREGDAIVSGMAKGVDSYAQTACINAGGFTIAVVGNGLDICYPKEHQSLMDAIEEQGLILSEYPPGTPAAGYNFPRRNRIIAALSRELVVMNPGIKSGTSSTVEWAEKLGRKTRIVQ